jgi:hypothetical protein
MMVPCLLLQVLARGFFCLQSTFCSLIVYFPLSPHVADGIKQEAQFLIMDRVRRFVQAQLVPI